MFLKENKTKIFCLFVLFLLINIRQLYGFDPALANKLQNTLDSVRLAINLKGISSSLTIPGQGTWFGVSGISHQGVNISKNMYFGIASNTKTFISVLILKLREQNLVNLDDSIYHWIDNYQFIDSAITIRQLLNHTSGITDITENQGFSDSILSNPNRLWTTQELLARFLSSPYFPKGQGFHYSNTNYLLLGLIIKSVTNSDISVNLRQKILTPLNLNNTFFPLEESIPDTMAQPWANGINISSVPRTSLLSSAWSAGAMYSNSENMTRWYQLLFGGQVLSSESLNQMLTFSAQSNNSYGLGVIRYIINGRTLWGHSGSIRGYTSSFLYDTTSKMSINVMTNQYPGNAYLVSSALFNTVVNFITSINNSGSIYHSYYELYQNYPNPFNPVTKISFQLPVVSSSSLKIFDITGKEVATLVNEVLQPGTYETTFDGSSFNSGIYFYQLMSGYYKETKKMLMLK